MPILRKFYVFIDVFFGKKLSYKLKKNGMLKKIFYSKIQVEVQFTKPIEILLEEGEKKLKNIIETKVIEL